MTRADVIEAEFAALRAKALVAKGGTPCLHLPCQTLDEARALKAAKAFEWAKNNPNPSCKWKGVHQTSQYGNWCSICGSEDLPPPHFYPAKSAEIIDHPAKAEQEIAYAWSRL